MSVFQLGKYPQIALLSQGGKDLKRYFNTSGPNILTEEKRNWLIIAKN